MTLDEAIKHTEEVAEEKEKEAKEWHENQVRKCKLIPFPFSEMDYTRENECKQCAKEHRQLTKWLKELKQLREQEPCEDAISRKALFDMCKKEIDHISKNWQNYHSPSEAKSGFAYIATNIYDLPPVNPQPKSGHWIDKFGGEYRCSCCREIISIDTEIEFPNGITYKYCPNCGCRMTEGVE